MVGKLGVMKIFLENSSSVLIHGDCLDVLGQLETQSVDLVIADPPYFLSNGGSTFVHGSVKNVDKGSWDRSRGVKKDFEFHLGWIRAVKKIMKPDASIWVSGTFHSIFQCGFALQASGFKILNEVIWMKEKITPNFSKKFFTASHESFIWSVLSESEKFIYNYDDMKKYFDDIDFLKLADRQMHTVWRMSGVSEQEKKYGVHPTQKPVKLYERIILATSKEGDMVLDPFCGSGSSGVASLMLKRKYTGIDLSPDYLEIAKRRIKDLDL